MTRKRAVEGLLAIAVAAVLFGNGAIAQDEGGPEPSDAGYFLSLKQKGQLIWTGRIQDSAGNWYDIWIVPGYVQPGRRARTYLRRAGSDFAEYVRREKYHDLAEASGEAFEWAFDDCLTDFTVKGVPRAWDRYWSKAKRRTRQRVFGWWFAYPWALMESTVDTVVRIPAGLTGTLLGTIWGGVAVPGYHAVNSGAAGTWHFVVDTVLFPVAGCTWNTVIAPPLALAGQKPAPSRVDGFWVRQLREEQIRAASKLETPVSRKEIEALAQWGRVLLTTTQPYEERRQALWKQAQAERDAINKKAQQAQEDLSTEERESVRSLGNDPSHQEVVNYLRDQGFDARRTSRAAADVRRYLETLDGLSPSKISDILSLLSRYPPSDVDQPPIRPKTDPVQNSIEVIKEMD